MNELNTQFPGILLGYVSNVGYHLSSDECNELTKLWSHNEYNYDKLKTENDWYKEKNLEWQKKYDTDTDQLSAENERLREALQYIENFADEDTTYMVEQMQEIAKQTLNEVTK